MCYRGRHVDQPRFTRLKSTYAHSVTEPNADKLVGESPRVSSWDWYAVGGYEIYPRSYVRVIRLSVHGRHITFASVWILVPGDGEGELEMEL